MRVERLEIFGFKSFMERLVLPLETGITGVVGPNGCGKSNVVDALRWVLGETRASQLRGDLLEDVIFNGTESLRPLGLAEVSIVIRADKDSFYQDLVSYYEQIEIGEKGIAPVGVIDAAQTVISEQGQTTAKEVAAGAIGEPENCDQLGPENTDVVLAEDAAVEALEGEAESLSDAPPMTAADIQASATSVVAETATGDFLADIKASLSKYAWLQSVSEVQITRRLYRSGESEFFINKVQCRLKDLKEFFRVVGLAARGYTIIAQGEIGRIISAKPDERRLVIEEAAHIAGFREHMNAVGKRLVDTQGQLVRIDDVIKEVARQVASLKRQAARAVTRAQLKEELVVAERELFTDTLVKLGSKIEDVKRRIDALAQAEQDAQAELTEAQSSEQQAREESVRFDSEIEHLRFKADQIKDELTKRGREIGLCEAKLRELNSLVHARSTEIRRLDERKVMLSQRQHESKESLTKLEAQEEELEESLRALDLSGEDELKQLSVNVQVLREEQRLRDRSIREMRDKLVSAQSRREALQAQLTAASPLTHLKRALGGENKMPVEITGDYKLLVDGIKVSDRYTKALQSVLAERASFLVVDEITKVARAFQEVVLKADPSNKRGIGVGLFAAVPEEPQVGGEFPEMEGISPLLSHVETMPWSHGLVSKLLASVFVAADLDSAFRYFELGKAVGGLGDEAVIVTESGDLVSAWSFYSLRHEGGVIQMKSKVDEATRIIDENQGAYDVLVAERDEVAARITADERRHAELVRMIQQSQARLREIGNRQGEIRGRLQSERKMCMQLESDIQRIEPQAQELQQQLDTLEESIAEVTEKISVLKQQDNSDLESALNEATTMLRELENKRRALRDSSAQMLRAVEFKRQGYEACRDRLYRERMSSERLQGEIGSAQAHIREKLGEEVLTTLLEAAQSVERLDDRARGELEGKVSGIRQRLEREGEVDPGVVDQHEIESKRLDDLTTQKDDLIRAAETLQVTLGELSEACTRRFAQTFEAISKNFAYFGPKLFGGGSAELRLIDPSRPLESGVEVLVRPPGKKPKSIDLLSGGEKALCAIALVFSMFMVRPSPLCVLDEVDAPLDEANVHRFVSFIKEMSSRTQFLMITHNKQSMAAADTLVGVTMPTPGASKVLTVSLHEAVKQVA
jgi:chromosome segregation protein